MTDVMPATGDRQSHGDNAAVAEKLRRALDAQRHAFARGAPDYKRRVEALERFRDAVYSRQQELVRTVSDDFGGRAHEETILLELFPLYAHIRHALRHLKGWMAPRRVPSAWFLLPSRTRVVYQPLGVVGVMGAWNYQLLLTLSPVTDALAAGNHVMLKPSEGAPRTADAIARLIAETFPADYVTTVTGGAEVASAFSSLPFDHLIFTGSTRVGALVMQAASANLTPVTLELGGKSPVIVHREYPLATASQRIWTGKLYNAGQTCVAPDYVLVPEEREAEFEQLSIRTVSELYPRLVDNPEYTRIVNQRHYERLAATVVDAAVRGARVVAINPANESCTPDNKVFRPTLVFKPADTMTVMQEEIFGPVLPVVTYRTLDDAIAFVNGRPRPLALYYFDNDGSRVDDVVQRTMSGGVTVNDVMYHLGQPNLPFGGVGMSGMGHYHGFDGFETFSKKRGIMIQGRWSTTSLFRPPYGPRAHWLMRQLLRLAVR